MAFDYINEAFKKLQLLDEAMFKTSPKGINQLVDFMDNGDMDEVVRVIDPNATEEDELEPSYIGKVILNCNVCHSHVFEDKTNVAIDEEGCVNCETACPYCGEQEGFVIIGEIAPFGATLEDETAEVEETEFNDSEEQPAEEANEALGVGAGLALGGAAIGAGLVGSKMFEDEEDNNMSRASKRAMQEDFKEVTITTDDQHMEMTSDDNGKVTVTTEPIQEETTEEVIAPISAETEEEILTNNDVEEQPEETSDEEVVDIDFTDVDEDSFNDLGESYLRNVYNNVESFKTTSVSATDSALIVEGVIKFNSGVEKTTGFIFEAQDVNPRGQIRFTGHNKHLTEAKDAFTLVGCVDNKKLFVESLKYNYTVNDNAVRGLVRRK